MSSWRPAPSISAALLEADRRWPTRARASDGTIGDAAHAASRSDHNPDERGVVHAFDLTHDPAHGVDGAELVAEMHARRDPRVAYTIFRSRITWGVAHNGYLAWTPAPYSRLPHTAHFHVSIWSDLNLSQAGLLEVSRRPLAEHDLSPWWGPASSPAPSSAEELHTMLTTVRGGVPAIVPLLGRAGRVIVAADHPCIARLYVGRRGAWQIGVERLELDAAGRSYLFTADAQLAVLSVVASADPLAAATIRDSYA